MKRHIAIVLLISMASLLLTGFQRNETIMARRRSSIASLYYGAGCNGTTTQASCTTTGTTIAFSNVFQYGNPITTGTDASGYTVQACGFYNGLSTGSTGTMQCSIYASGATTSPISGCTSSASSGTLTNSAWTENAHFSGCTLSASTTYYLMFQVSTSSGSDRVYNTGATEYYHASTYGTWASTVTWSTLANELFNSYVRVTAN
jgi:hypothetical protein